MDAEFYVDDSLYNIIMVYIRRWYIALFVSVKYVRAQLFYVCYDNVAQEEDMLYTALFN